MKSRLFICGILLFSSVHATDIYRWVDDKGRTQISDVVPEKYKASATKIDSRKYELSADQRAEAAARAARERASAEEGKRRDALEAAAAAASAASGPAPAQTPPRATVDAKSDCATLHRIYQQSQECFAPYITSNGIKPEAFAKCTQVVSPSAKCGPSKAY